MSLKWKEKEEFDVNSLRGKRLKPYRFIVRLCPGLRDRSLGKVCIPVVSVPSPPTIPRVGQVAVLNAIVHTTRT